MYIIKSQENPAPKGLMRYKGGSPPLMISTTLRAAMIYQACGLDKKKPHPVRMRFFLVEHA
ncbi:MAG: hypothetical protein IJZ24_01670 [Clostridia bacterium]|nr:hypothetical protein [Clostridia bacterium]